MSRAFDVGRAERYRTHAGELLGKRGGSGSEHFVCLFRFLKVDLGIKRCLVVQFLRKVSRDMMHAYRWPLANRLRHAHAGREGKGRECSDSSTSSHYWWWFTPEVGGDIGPEARVRRRSARDTQSVRAMNRGKYKHDDSGPKGR
jgi:hypothetical protein